MLCLPYAGFFVVDFVMVVFVVVAFVAVFAVVVVIIIIIIIIPHCSESRIWLAVPDLSLAGQPLIHAEADVEALEEVAVDELGEAVVPANLLVRVEAQVNLGEVLLMCCR